MKKLLLPLAIVLSLSLISPATHAKKAKRAAVAQPAGAKLLQQVDTVAPYFNSEKVALAPRLGDGVVEVEATILSPDLLADTSGLQNYMTRLIDTFMSTLKDRIAHYAPALSKRFNPNSDIAFVVNAGAERTPVGIWKGGTWQSWTQPAAPKDAKSKKKSKKEKVEKSEDEGTPGRKGCSCPARR